MSMQSCNDTQTTERTALWKFIMMQLLLSLLSSSSNK